MSEVIRYSFEQYPHESYMAENTEGEYVAWQDYAALQEKFDFKQNLTEQIVELQKQRDALAAENAALKSNLMFWDAEDPEMPYDHPEDIANNCCIDVGVEFDVQVAAKMPSRTYRVSSADDCDCTLELVSGGMPQTPATVAYLNSVRAEGVEMFAEALKDKYHGIAYELIGNYETNGEEDRISDEGEVQEVLAFAAQLRAGEPS